MNLNETWPAIDHLLPHRGSMLLLDHVLELADNHARVAAKADCQTWYADHNGEMPAWVGIELMAQAIAVHVGWCKSTQGLPPKQGVLLGTRAYRTEVSALRGLLTIEAHRTFMDESGMGAYECSIASEGQCVATAMVKVFEPENFQVFLNSQLSVR